MRASGELITTCEKAATLILGDGGARRVADCQDISWRHVEGGTEPLGVPAAAIAFWNAVKIRENPRENLVP